MSGSSLAQQHLHSRASRLFFAAGAALALAALLPWVTVSGTGYLSAISVNTHPSSGAVALVLIIAGSYAWTGWALREHSGSRRLMLAMWLVNACVVFIVLAVGSSLNDQQGAHVTAGGGYVAAFCAAVLAIVASITLHRSRAGLRGGADVEAPVNPR